MTPWRELRETLRYRIDNVFAGGTLAKVVLLLILVGAVLLVGMSAGIVGLFGKENEQVEGVYRDVDTGFWDSLWWAAAHVLDPSYVLENYGATAPVLLISIIISIAGLVIFGLLVGLISSSIEDRIDTLRKGNSVVKESGHLLILGWSSKVIAILERFREHSDRMKIVILADHEVDDMRDALRAGLGRYTRHKIILRSGQPSRLHELHRVSFDEASSIILIADEKHASDAHDLDVIKTLMVVASFRDWKRGRPRITAEVTRKDNVDVATIAGDYGIPIVVSSEIVSRVLVQSARQPGLAHVYQELFSFDGPRLYIREAPECAGKAFANIIDGFPGAVPLGVTRNLVSGGRVQFVPQLNPPPDYVVAEGERLIMLSEDPQVRYSGGAAERRPQTADRTRFANPMPERYAILGWNDSLFDVLPEFDKYLLQGSTVDVYARHDANTAQDLFAHRMRRPLSRIRMQYHHRPRIDRKSIHAMPLAQFNGVILLGSEDSSDDQGDASVISSLLVLREIQQKHGARRPHVVAEVMNVDHAEAITLAAASDLVIGAEIGSMLLAQLSQQQMLHPIYEELLSAGGTEIYIKPAGRYVPLDRPTTFRDIQRAAMFNEEIALGLKIHAQSNDATAKYGLHLTPEKDAAWTLGAHDRVVVLASDLFA